MSSKTKLQKIILNERQQWFLWIPVLYAIGILIYFAIPKEPNIYVGIASSVLLLLTALIFYKKKLIFYILLVLFFISSGFAGANIRALRVKAPVLEKEIHSVSVQGKIEEIDTYKTGHRIFLTNIKTDKISAEKTPYKIRLTVLTDIGDAKAGDVIELRASLSPPPKAVLPDTYDFSKNAYFQGIGAVGFAVSDVQKITIAQNTFDEVIQQTRNVIAARLVNAIGGMQAEIAKALFMGDTGGIDADTILAIRNSGLAHLLSISGLHLVIVCAICFKMCRMLLALFPPISLNYNTKKLAAICAIIGSYFYLLISGNPIPAERSFIMSTMVFLAILFGRSGTPLRVVAIAALYILITAPENIISPSFQMSFGAVIGLISAFGWLEPHLSRFASAYKVPKILMWILGTIISSIVATIATAPFAIYHFNRNSPYGILANILAIPMTSFEIMPCGVLAMVLMPLHLEWVVAWPLRVGIDFIMWVANYVAALPYANATIPAINDWQLLLMVFGLLWLALWQTNIRLVGIGIVLIVIFAAFFNKTPDVMVNSDANLFAVKDENGDLLFSSSRAGSFVKQVWSARAGQEEIFDIADSESNDIACDTVACIYKKNGYKVAFVKHPVALEAECDNADIFINLTSISYHCARALKQINVYNLKKQGTHEIYLESDVRIKTVFNGRNRVWE